jgi:Flp pilus assembly pilin Flp
MALRTVSHRKFADFLGNDDGTGAIEYSLMAILIALTIALVLRAVGFSLIDIFNTVATSLPVGAS